MRRCWISPKELLSMTRRYSAGPPHLRWAYLIRFHTASTRAPSVVAGFVYFNSSAVRPVITRFQQLPLRVRECAALSVKAHGFVRLVDRVSAEMGEASLHGGFVFICCSM